MVCNEALHTNFLGDLRVLPFNGSSYFCFTLPQYDSPYLENETIRVFIQSALSGALMIGREGDFGFNLYIDDGKLVHYELYQNGAVLVSVIVTSPLSRGGQLVILRTESEITIFHNDAILGMATINVTVEELITVRFTDICVGGGFFTVPVFGSSSINALSNVYYNLYALFDNGTSFMERNVAVTRRVNFINSNANITLPGSLALNSANRIDISFRTSQQNAILLHSEDSSNYFRVSINNTQIVAAASFGGVEATGVCTGFTVSMYEWYELIIQPVLVPPGDEQPLVLLDVYNLPSQPSQLPIVNCMIQDGILTSFSSVPLVLGGRAANVDGLMGCLELEYNDRVANLETVLTDDIGTENCEPCSISPCMNGGTCNNLNDYEFNCSCADPFFGQLCGEYNSTLCTIHRFFHNK